MSTDDRTPGLPFAVFDEFGKGADDRVQDYAAACVRAAVPPGWKVVPVEPTEDMLTAAAHASMQHFIDCIQDPSRLDEAGSEEMIRKTHASRYRSMLRAAPAPGGEGETNG